MNGPNGRSSRSALGPLCLGHKMSVGEAWEGIVDVRASVAQGFLLPFMILM